MTNKRNEGTSHVVTRWTHPISEFMDPVRITLRTSFSLEYKFVDTADG